VNEEDPERPRYTSVERERESERERREGGREGERERERERPGTQLRHESIVEAPIVSEYLPGTQSMHAKGGVACQSVRVTTAYLFFEVFAK